MKNLGSLQKNYGYQREQAEHEIESLLKETFGRMIRYKESS